MKRMMATALAQQEPRLRIWLINSSEFLPIDAGNQRPMRTGLMASVFQSLGCDVVWWNSTFIHTSKRQRSATSQVIQAGQHLELRLMHCMAYPNNLSWRRIVNHVQLGMGFAGQAPQVEKPDVIFASFPTIELCVEAVRYGKRNAIPVVLDIRDLWPDVLWEVFPKALRAFAPVCTLPYLWGAKTACREATCITALTESYLEWGLKMAGRPQNDLDRVVSMSYSDGTPSLDEIASANAMWDRMEVNQHGDEFVACFFGTVGRQFDLETVIAAARSLESGPRKFNFVLCGDGDKLENYRNMSSGCSNIAFPGWMGSAEIWTLMRRSAVGLAPYRESDNFRSNLPNKPVEYLSAGLPIISCAEGETQRILEVNECGLSYAPGNADQLAERLIQLYDDRDLLRRYSQNANALFSREYVAEEQYADLLKHLERIVAQV